MLTSRTWWSAWQPQPEVDHLPAAVDDYASARPFEIDREEIRLLMKLGEGYFGESYKRRQISVITSSPDWLSVV
jgi:hypothetical protein